MRGKLVMVTALAAVIGGCASGGSPATTPTSDPTTTATVTTLPPATTSTAAATTTVDRVAEIEAIFQDLEERRLQALYDGDRDAFRALFANDEYLERSMVLFDLVEFVDEWTVPRVDVVKLLADRPDCIAVRVATEYSATLRDGDEGDTVHVIEMRGEQWGISYAGEGWTCTGPHPLSP